MQTSMQSCTRNRHRNRNKEAGTDSQIPGRQAQAAGVPPAAKNWGDHGTVEITEREGRGGAGLGGCGCLAAGAEHHGAQGPPDRGPGRPPTHPPTPARRLARPPSRSSCARPPSPVTPVPAQQQQHLPSPPAPRAHTHLPPQHTHHALTPPEALSRAPVRWGWGQ
jgi:hypothetical protein